MKNLLIVEGKNDKFFIEALIVHLNLKDLEVFDSLISKFDEVQTLEGLDLKKLTSALKALKNRIQIDDISKVGVLIDQNDKTDQERLQLLNTAIKESFSVDNVLQKTNELYTILIDNIQSFLIATHFTNVNGSGNLESVLRKIKNQSSPYADCMQSWQDCLIKNNINNGKGIKPSDFNKRWVDTYVRYDTCSKDDQKQAGSKCTLNAVLKMKKPIWNFEHPSLDNLKSFLKLFS